MYMSDDIYEADQGFGPITPLPYSRHEPWTLAPWLTGLIVALVIFIILIPAFCSACYHYYSYKLGLDEDKSDDDDYHPNGGETSGDDEESDLEDGDDNSGSENSQDEFDDVNPQRSTTFMASCCRSTKRPDAANSIGKPRLLPCGHFGVPSKDVSTQINSLERGQAAGSIWNKEEAISSTPSTECSIQTNKAMLLGPWKNYTYSSTESSDSPSLVNKDYWLCESNGFRPNCFKCGGKLPGILEEKSLLTGCYHKESQCRLTQQNFLVAAKEDHDDDRTPEIPPFPRGLLLKGSYDHV